MKCQQDDFLMVDWINEAEIPIGTEKDGSAKGYYSDVVFQILNVFFK